MSHLIHNFRLRHTPALFFSSALTFGGLLPFYSSASAILEFGLPSHVAESPAAQSTFILASGRGTAIGIAALVFYFRGQYRAVDTVMLSLGYVGCVDGWVCWKEGVPGRGVFRFLCGAGIALCGFWGLTDCA